MYRCFRDSMVNPKFIPHHLKMKTGQFILYIALLTLLLSIPLYVNLFFNFDIASKISSVVASDLYQYDEPLDYKIEGNQLLSTGGNDLTIVPLKSMSTGEIRLINTYLVFNPLEKNLPDDLVVNKNVALIIELKQEHLEIYLSSPSDTSGKVNMNMKVSDNFDISYSYEELNINGIEFRSSQSNSGNYNFKLNLNKAVEKIFKPYAYIYYLTMIPTLYFSTLIAIMFEALLLTLMMLFFTRMIGISFKTLFRLVVLCLTPMAVFEILCLLPFGAIWYYGVTILGQILTIIYLQIAIRQISTTSE